VSVAPGGSTTTSVVISPQNGFSANSAVTFTCSGLPAGTTCNFSAATSSSGNLLSSTLTINAAATTAATLRAPGGLLLAGSPLVFGLFLVRRRGQRGGRLLMLVPLAAVALTMFAGCSSKNTTSTAGGTESTVTVTATSGSIMHSTTFTLTVT
jgi:hypothetical protein